MSYMLRQFSHNSATMAVYCRRHGVSLAPHGKTPMASALFDRQLSDGVSEGKQ